MKCKYLSLIVILPVDGDVLSTLLSAYCQKKKTDEVKLKASGILKCMKGTNNANLKLAPKNCEVELGNSRESPSIRILTILGAALWHLPPSTASFYGCRPWIQVLQHSLIKAISPSSCRLSRCRMAKWHLGGRTETAQQIPSEGKLRGVRVFEVSTVDVFTLQSSIFIGAAHISCECDNVLSRNDLSKTADSLDNGKQTNWCMRAREWLFSFFLIDAINNCLLLALFSIEASLTHILHLTKEKLNVFRMQQKKSILLFHRCCVVLSSPGEATSW